MDEIRSVLPQVSHGGNLDIRLFNVYSVNEPAVKLVPPFQFQLRRIRNCGNHAVNTSGSLTSVPVFFN